MRELFENEKIIRDFLELTAIDSESYDERRMADELIIRLKELGLTVSEDGAGEKIGGNAGNLYAVFEGDPAKEPILLSAHLDTVKPGIGKKAILKDGVIRSDGSTVLGSDDVAGIVEILEGIKRVKESGRNHRTVEVLFTAAEEVYGKGASVFDYSILKSKQAYTLDSSGDVGSAVIAAPTLLSFEVKVKGRSAHAGFAASKGINAIAVASEAISGIRFGQIDDFSTRNVGLIEGGVATNIVPGECLVKGEIRSLNHENALRLLEETLAAFRAAADKNGAEIEKSHEIHIKAYKVEEDSAVAKRFQKVCEGLSLPGTLRSTFGGSDNNIFCEKGIEGVVLSCGMDNVHTTGEFIKVENLRKGADLVKKLILED